MRCDFADEDGGLPRGRSVDSRPSRLTFDSNERFRLFHASFGEFLRHKKFAADEKELHARFAKYCGELKPLSDGDERDYSQPALGLSHGIKAFALLP